MRLQDFLHQRETLEREVRELASMVDTVYNAYGGSDIVVCGKPMRTSRWSLSTKLREAIVDEIAAKRKEVQAELDALEARCKIS